MADTTFDTDQGFAILGEEACWELLPRRGVARLAWADAHGRIVVVPINYGRDGRTIVLCTGETDLLAAARAGRRFAVQVDDLEPALRSGWSVLIDATLAEVDDEELAGPLALLVEPWLRESLPHVLLVGAARVTGRSLHHVGGVEIIELDPDDRP